MKNNPWKKFIIVVSALLIVIMVCVTTNLITNSITNSLRMQPLGGVQQQQGVVNGGGFAQNNGGQMGVTPDSNGSFGGDSSLGGNSADQGLTAAPQGGGSSDTQTSNDPLKMNKSQLINYYNSCLKKSYSQKMNATKTEKIDVTVSGIDIGGAKLPANLNPDKIANSIVESNTKKNNVVQTKSFVNGKATDDGSAVEKFVVPTNLYDAAVNSINIQKSGAGYQVVIVLNAESCPHTGKTKYNASCTWPLDFNAIDFGSILTVQSCTFNYPGTKLTAMIDGQGRVTAVKTEMPLNVKDAKGKAFGINVTVGSISGKWTCQNEMKFAS